MMNKQIADFQETVKTVGLFAQKRCGVFVSIFLFTFLLSIGAESAGAQAYPDEIRGYKVHKAKIIVTNKGEPNAPDNDTEESEAFVRLTEPELTGTSLTGLTFEISADIDPLVYKGRIDFLTFRDFKVNGLDVRISEYSHSFEFNKNEPISLPKPVSIFLGTRQAIRGAVGELRDSKPEWTVTGTVFVFGRFKKWGFNVKRVVPVEVNVKIKNPVRDGRILGGVVPSI